MWRPPPGKGAGQDTTKGPDCICALGLESVRGEFGRAPALGVDEHKCSRGAMLAAAQRQTDEAAAYVRAEAGRRHRHGGAHGCVQGLCAAQTMFGLEPPADMPQLPHTVSRVG